MHEADIRCDICGRAPIAEFAGAPRLNYCPSCQRFACTTCWIPTGGTCRQCLLGGDVAQGRLRPRISETFEASTPLSLRERRSSSQPAPAPHWVDPVVAGAQTGEPRPRLRGLLPVAAAVVILGGLILVNLPSALEPGSGDRPSTAAPAVLPVGTAPAPPPPSSAAPPPSNHIVAPGDTLTSIAASAYGDEALWPLIYEANRAVIPDPDALRVGQSLVIPPP